MTELRSEEQLCRCLSQDFMRLALSAGEKLLLRMEALNACRLIGISEEELLSIRDNPGKFEALKDPLLGKQIKANGRVNKNLMFDRLEFIASDVNELNPDDLLQEME